MYLIFPRVQPLATQRTWIVVRWYTNPLGRAECFPGTVKIHLRTILPGSTVHEDTPDTFLYKDLRWDVVNDQGLVPHKWVKRIIVEDPILVRF
jgi:hypothetical protein